MGKFVFNYAGGQYVVNAPAGTSEAAARAVFDQQIETGSLTGLVSGQTLSAVNQLKQGLATAASQIAPSSAQLSGAATNLTRLTGVPIKSPMDLASFVNVNAQLPALGALSGKQVQGLLAQASSATNQAANAVSLDKGIGKFGIAPDQLESTGFLKPGTLDQYAKNFTVTQADIAEATRINSQGGTVTPDLIARNRKIAEVIQSPTVWTGKAGISSLTSLTSDVNKQTLVQTDVMKNGLDNLTKAGAIPSGVSSAQLGSLVQAAAKVGAGLVTAWTKGTAPSSVVGLIDTVAKQGQTAINFTNTKIPESLAGERTAVGAANTVNRKVLDQSIKQFVGSAKVPTVNYGQDTAPAAASASTPKSAEAAVLEGKIMAAENGQKTRRELLAKAEAAGDVKAIAYWQEKIREGDQEIANLQAQLASLG